MKFLIILLSVFLLTGCALFVVFRKKPPEKHQEEIKIFRDEELDRIYFKYTDENIRLFDDHIKYINGQKKYSQFDYKNAHHPVDFLTNEETFKKYFSELFEYSKPKNVKKHDIGNYENNYKLMVYAIFWHIIKKRRACLKSNVKMQIKDYEILKNVKEVHCKFENRIFMQNEKYEKIFNAYNLIHESSRTKKIKDTSEEKKKN